MEITWPGKENLRNSTFEAIKFDQLSDQFGNQNSSIQFKPHLLIQSDNLIGLRELARRREQFHLIYIDPPYNSGQDFSFSDKTKHSADHDHLNQTHEDRWMHFMMPRLMLAHAIMAESGVMYVSIDDRQMASLQLLMSEIFGSQNFVAVFKWKKKRKPSFLSKHVSSVFEYILVFAKNYKKLPKFLGEPATESTRPVLNAPNAVSERFLRVGTPARCGDGAFDAGVYRNRSLEFELLDKLVVEHGKLTSEVRVRGRFRVDQATLDRSVFITSKFGLRRRIEDSELGFKHVSDDCSDWPTNEDAESECKQIFGKKVFEYAKPALMLQKLVAMYPTQQLNEVNCLDFFAGTGSFAEAVMRQNHVDKVLRRFVCIQSSETIIYKGDSLAQQWRTIFDLTLFRAKRACQLFGDTRSVEVWDLCSKTDDTPRNRDQSPLGVKNESGNLAEIVP